MIVAIRVQPSKQGGEDEYVRLAEMATMSEILAEAHRHRTALHEGPGSTPPGDRPVVLRERCWRQLA